MYRCLWTFSLDENINAMFKLHENGGMRRIFLSYLATGYIEESRLTTEENIHI